MTGHGPTLLLLRFLLSIETIACDGGVERLAILLLVFHYQWDGITKFLVLAEFFEDFELGHD